MGEAHEADTSEDAVAVSGSAPSSTVTQMVQPRLRVLLTGDSLHVGGAERHMVDLAIALQRLGHLVTVACSDGGAMSSMVRDHDIPVHVLAHRLVKRRVGVQFSWNLGRLLREGRFDVVHGHMYAGSLAAALAMQGTRLPFVVTEHSEAQWRGLCARAWSRWLYGRTAATIAVTQSIRHRLITLDHVPDDRIIVIANAVATREPPHSHPRSERGPDGPIVGVVARLQPEKGVGVFLEAAAGLTSLFPTCRFVVVGDGPLRDPLMRQVRELGMGDRTHFLGFRTDARALMEEFDALVVPSLSEGAPLVILEAMSAGVPIVATSVGGIPEQIQDGREGLLVSPGNAPALRDACALVLGDPDLAHRLGCAGLQRVLSRFDHGEMVRQIEAVYRSVIDATASSPTHTTALRAHL
ncbi:MAG: glycosyltransferase family 4 protein [Chloroflexota bacterium]